MVNPTSTSSVVLMPGIIAVHWLCPSDTLDLTIGSGILSWNRGSAIFLTLGNFPEPMIDQAIQGIFLGSRKFRTLNSATKFRTQGWVGNARWAVPLSCKFTLQITFCEFQRMDIIFDLCVLDRPVGQWRQHWSQKISPELELSHFASVQPRWLWVHIQWRQILEKNPIQNLRARLFWSGPQQELGLQVGRYREFTWINFCYLAAPIFWSEFRIIFTNKLGLKKIPELQIAQRICTWKMRSFYGL